MFFVESKVTIGDNSGGRLGKCIKPLGNKRIFAIAGELVLLSLKKVYARKKAKKGTISKAVIVQGASWLWRELVHCYRCHAWCCVSLKKDGYTPKATRIKLPVAFELYRAIQTRALLMANYRILKMTFWLRRHFNYSSTIDLKHTMQYGHKPIPEFHSTSTSIIIKGSKKSRKSSFMALEVLKYLFNNVSYNRLSRYKIKVSMRAKKFEYRSYMYGWLRWHGHGMYNYLAHYMTWLLPTLMGRNSTHRGVIQTNGTMSFHFHTIRPWLNVLPINTESYRGLKFGINFNFAINFKQFTFITHDYEKMDYATHIYSVMGFPIKRTGIYSRFYDALRDRNSSLRGT
jgi:ribosomal protein L14